MLFSYNVICSFSLYTHFHNTLSQFVSNILLTYLFKGASVILLSIALSYFHDKLNAYFSAAKKSLHQYDVNSFLKKPMLLIINLKVINFVEGLR